MTLFIILRRTCLKLSPPLFPFAELLLRGMNYIKGEELPDSSCLSSSRNFFQEYNGTSFAANSNGYRKYPSDAQAH